MGRVSRLSLVASLAFMLGCAGCCGCCGCGGCGDGSRPTAPAPDNRTPAEKFRDTQGDTNTPHGKIVPDSVKDNNGRIDYDTEDGSKWTVDPPRTRADGTPEYGTPEKRK